MIGRTECYDKETNETTYDYYWYDYNFVKHDGFTSCFDAFTALEKFIDNMEEKLNATGTE